MGKGFKSGGSGGGGGGAYSGLLVTGGLSRPTKPNEGMVWAKTDVDITGCFMSAEQPENLAHGNLWIKISNSSNIKVGTTLGNDYITIMLNSVSQYVNGELVSVEAKSFQNGVWVEFITYLYKNGDECTDITGGWKTYSSYGGTELTINNVSGKLNVVGQLRANRHGGGTVKKVNIDNKSQIVFTGKVNKIHSSYPIYIALFTSNTATSFTGSVVAAQTAFPAVGTYANKVLMDIPSTLSGEYYIGFIATGDNGSSTSVINDVSIDSLWLQ